MAAASRRLWLPLIALGELEVGARLAQNAAAQHAALAAFLPAASLLPLSVQTTKTYADLRVALRRAGTPIPENDLWIAASAVEHDWPLLTLDSHFQLMPGLRLA